MQGSHLDIPKTVTFYVPCKIEGIVFPEMLWQNAEGDNHFLDYTRQPSFILMLFRFYVPICKGGQRFAFCG